MMEVVGKRTPAGLRGLFTVLVLMCELRSPENMLVQFADAMTEDWRFKGMSKSASLLKLRRYIARRLEHAGTDSRHELLENVDVSIEEDVNFRTSDDPSAALTADVLPTQADLDGNCCDLFELVIVKLFTDVYHNKLNDEQRAVTDAIRNREHAYRVGGVRRNNAIFMSGVAGNTSIVAL
jgi:hypothetical protein